MASSRWRPPPSSGSSRSRARVDGEVLVERLLDAGYLAGIPLREGFEGTDAEGGLLVAVTERRTRAEIDGFARAFAGAVR